MTEINEKLLTAGATIIVAITGAIKTFRFLLKKKKGSSEMSDLKELTLDTKERVCVLENKLAGISRDLNKLKTFIREVKGEQKSHYRTYA